MDIHAIVPECQLAALRRNAPPGCRIRQSTLGQYRALGVLPCGDLLALDPSVIREDALAELLALLKHNGQIVFLSVGYVAQAPLTIAEIVAQLPIDVVFCADEALRLYLHRRAAYGNHRAVGASVLPMLVPSLCRLPPRLALSIMALFAWLPIPRSPEVLLAVEGMDRRTAERKLHDVGLANAGSLLRVARVARMGDLAHSGAPLAARLRDSGFRSERAWRDQYRRVFGWAAHNEALAITGSSRIIPTLIAHGRRQRVPSTE